MPVYHNCLSLSMKNFKNVTIVTLGVIAVLFAGNIYFLCRLYSSVKEQYLLTARQCLAEADVVEIMKRLKSRYNYPDSNISIVFDINHRLTESGKLTPAFPAPPESSTTGEKLMGLSEAFNITLAYNLHTTSEQIGGPADFGMLDSLFLAEMHRVGLHPRHAFVLPADSVPPQSVRNYWQFDYTLFKGRSPIYRAYIAYPLGDLLYSTGGIIATTALIMAALAFAFFYLIRTVVRLRSLDEMKEDFINNMTHELKTPIAAAYSANDTLLNCGKHHDAEKRERYLRLALEQLSRLSELVESILSMSMERRRSFTLSPENVALEPFLSEIAALHTMKAAKHADINLDIEPGLEIRCDPVHFGNIMNNLLDNAIKYSGDTVAVDIHADPHGITVADNGIGIPAKALPHIFDKFYRVPSGRRQDVRGYGIGLYYVRSIVEKHGWTIGVQSTPGKGSVFTITFDSDEK